MTLETQIDRRPIFTVGVVWTDFVKRLPRMFPKYRSDAQNQDSFSNLAALQKYALQQQNLTQEQRITLAQQQFGAQYPYYGGGLYQPFGWPYA